MKSQLEAQVLKVKEELAKLIDMYDISEELWNENIPSENNYIRRRIHTNKETVRQFYANNFTISTHLLMCAKQIDEKLNK